MADESDPERPDGDGTAAEPLDGDGPDVLPTVACSRCDRTWDLEYELDVLRAGNRAVEQFALDHERHTGHFPDDVRPWVADCRRCPDREGYLAERPARRWAETHARHTGHDVDLSPPSADAEPEVVVGDP